MSGNSIIDQTPPVQRLCMDPECERLRAQLKAVTEQRDEAVRLLTQLAYADTDLLDTSGARLFIARLDREGEDGE